MRNRPHLLASSPEALHGFRTCRPLQALAITLDRQPPALRSTRNRPRRAVRRGAAGPAKRPSSRLVVQEHKHGWASQRAVARRGGQGGPDAGRAVVTVSASVSGIRCPVSGASVRCPRVPVHATGVRCGRLSVRVSSVRRPAAARCPCAPASAVSDRNEVAGCGGGPAAARLGWPGSAWSPAMSMTARRLPEVGAWRSKLAQAVLGQRRVDLDVVVAVAGWAGRPGEGLDAREDRHREAAGGDHAPWSSCEAWAESAGR